MKEHCKYVVKVRSGSAELATKALAQLNNKELKVLCIGPFPLAGKRAAGELMLIPTGDEAKEAFRAAGVVWLGTTDVEKIAEVVSE